MKKQKYKIFLKIPKSLREKMIEDLRRPHDFAYERVGFMYTRSKIIDKNIILIIAVDYNSVDNENYIKDDSVGAKFNDVSIQKAMQTCLNKKSGCFHVHLHDHKGKPSPSFTDQKGLPGVRITFAGTPDKASDYKPLAVAGLRRAVR